jgi:hypothetical protein
MCLTAAIAQSYKFSTLPICFCLLAGLGCQAQLRCQAGLQGNRGVYERWKEER